MIEFRVGNLLEADADAIVNTVNCVGVMGKGIALQFKQAYPENFRAYETACKRGEVRLGHVFTYPTGQITSPRFIVNFPTKDHWRSSSKLADIRTGLKDLVIVLREKGITSIAIPPLGCGNGGLDWGDVYPLIEEAFNTLSDIRVLVYAPQPTPAADAMPVGTKRPRITRARALVVTLIERYRGPGYRLTKLEVQKLAYFLQTAGEPLKLNFVKHNFGPYAENLNHALRDMDGHLIRGFGDRSSDSSIYPIADAVEQAAEFLAEDNEAQSRLERVSRLIDGFEDAYGMELLATVHWVTSVLPAEDRCDPDKVVAAVHDWNERKRKIFQPHHIRKAMDRLRDLGWVTEAK